MDLHRIPNASTGNAMADAERRLIGADVEVTDGMIDEVAERLRDDLMLDRPGALADDFNEWLRTAWLDRALRCAREQAGPYDILPDDMRSLLYSAAVDFVGDLPAEWWADHLAKQQAIDADVGGEA